MKVFNYKYEEVLELDNDLFAYLVRCMEINEARERLINMEISLYPHLTKDNQRKLHKKVYKLAIPNELRKEKAVKVEDLQNIYGMGSIEDILKKDSK